MLSKRIVIPTGAAATVLACLGLTAAGSPSATAAPAYVGRASLRTTYLSNLYNVPLEYEDRFAAESGPGQRFDGMSGPADVEMQFAGEASATWRLAKRRELRASADIRYYRYIDNDIANYLQLRCGGRVDLTRRDHLDMRIAYIPDRFKRNFKTWFFVDDALATTFEPARYSQFAARVRYDRDWTKNLTAGLSYERAQRGFEKPFEIRDRTQHALEAHAERRIGRRVSVELEAGYARAATPSESVPGATPDEPRTARDRSFAEIGGAAAINVGLRPSWRAGLEFSLARRDYTTDVALDKLYHERTDYAWLFGANLRKRLGKNLALQGEWLIRRKTSDRTPSPEEAVDEDIAYEGNALGVGLVYTF